MINNLNQPRRRGFTLVELLVVVAIIGMLVALLMPALQSAREASRRTSCGNNLKQIYTASASHLLLLGHYPTGGWNAASGTNGMVSPDRGADWRQPGGWAYTILPFMEETNTYNTNAADRNRLPVPVFACPTRRRSPLNSRNTIMTDYAGNRGAWASSPSPLLTTSNNRDTTFGMPSAAGTIPIDDAAEAAAAATLLNTVQLTFNTGTSVNTGGIIFVGSSLPPARIRDGATNTYLFAEKYVPRAFYEAGGTGYENPAYAGDSPDTLRGGHRLPLSDSIVWTGTAQAGSFGGPHPGSFNAAFCDGSVRQIGFDISAQTHFLLSAREDRQPVTAP